VRNLLFVSMCAGAIGMVAACSQGDTHPPLLPDCENCGGVVVGGGTTYPDGSTGDAGSDADAGALDGNSDVGILSDGPTE